MNWVESLWRAQAAKRCGMLEEASMDLQNALRMLGSGHGSSPLARLSPRPRSPVIPILSGARRYTPMLLAVGEHTY